MDEAREARLGRFVRVRRGDYAGTGMPAMDFLDRRKKGRRKRRFSKIGAVSKAQNTESAGEGLSVLATPAGTNPKICRADLSMSVSVVLVISLILVFLNELSSYLLYLRIKFSSRYRCTNIGHAILLT